MRSAGEVSGVQAFRPPMRWRLWMWLGFGSGPVPQLGPAPEGWAEEFALVNTKFDMGFRSRLRVFFGGTIVVQIAIRTDVKVGGAQVASGISVMQPGFRLPTIAE